MVNVAILGFGVVGSGTAEVLSINKDSIKEKCGVEINLKRILDLRDFPESPFASLVTHEADDVFNDKDISICVETIGGARIAYEYTKRALSNGISVVTSNKELVSTHGVELLKLAKDNHCSYLYEAAVGGGIPIIRPLYRCLAANKIVKIAGIVNGTTNYILSSMKNKGISYEDALKQAQLNGYAEQNPSADVDGIDAQRKLSILSTISLNGLYVAPSSINAEGISKLTLSDIKFGNKINASLKLIAYFENKIGNKPIVYVAPHYVKNNNLLASVEDVFNAVLVEGNCLGESIFYGQGAGMLPTASAVCGDIVEVASNKNFENDIRLWHESADGDVILPYDEIAVSIVVRGPKDSADELKAAFSDYDVKVLVDDGEDSAITVRGIKHKDIAKNIAKVAGSSWLHYLR